MTATFDEFIQSLIANGEKSGYESQNVKTGAYGKFQILPGNWRVWAPKALNTLSHPWIMLQLRLGRTVVADKDTPPLKWWPSPTRDNQNEVARWRLKDAWDKHSGDAQRVAGMWQSGNGDPVSWGNRTIKYVNRVCVPLGYLPIPLLTGVV